MSVLKETLEGRQIIAVESSNEGDSAVGGISLLLDNGVSVDFEADEAWGGIYVRYEVHGLPK